MLVIMRFACGAMCAVSTAFNWGVMDSYELYSVLSGQKLNQLSVVIQCGSSPARLYLNLCGMNLAPQPLSKVRSGSNRAQTVSPATRCDILIF